MQAARKIMLAVSVFLSVSAIGCRQEATPSALAAEKVEPAGPVGCLGRITPGQRVMRVSAPPGSIIKELHVRRGATIAVGAEIAVLRDIDVARSAVLEAERQVAVDESMLQQARAGEKPASVAAQETAIRRQEAALQGAEKDLERKKSLSAEGLLPAMEVDAAVLSAETARHALRREHELLDSLKQVRTEDVAVAEKKLDFSRSRLESARVELNRNRILSPASATVLEIYAYPGEAVSDQGILDLGDMDKMFVDAEVYVSDLPRVHEGAKATITGQGFEGALTGRVAEILREIANSRLFPSDSLTAADKRVLTVRIRLDDPGKVRYLSNSQVSVRIEP